MTWCALDPLFSKCVQSAIYHHQAYKEELPEFLCIKQPHDKELSIIEQLSSGIHWTLSEKQFNFFNFASVFYFLLFLWY